MAGIPKGEFEGPAEALGNVLVVRGFDLSGSERAIIRQHMAFAAKKIPRQFTCIRYNQSEAGNGDLRRTLCGFSDERRSRRQSAEVKMTTRLLRNGNIRTNVDRWHEAGGVVVAGCGEFSPGESDYEKLIPWLPEKDQTRAHALHVAAGAKKTRVAAGRSARS